MLYFMHSSTSLQFLALLAAVGLFVWSLRNEGKGVLLARIVSLVVAILVIIGMGCTAWHTYKFWQEGYINGPIPMQMKMMMSNPHMAGKPPMMGHRPGMPVPNKMTPPPAAPKKAQ